MFGFFKRKKVDEWEKLFLRNVFLQLGEGYLAYVKQIDANVLERKRLERKKGKLRVGFGYSPIVTQFESPSSRTQTIANILTYEEISKKVISIDIVISYGLIVSYELLCENKYILSSEQIDLRSVRISSWGNEDYDGALKILGKNAGALLSDNDIYKVNVFGKDLYHLKGIGDGDFIGMGNDGVFYKVTHDPYCIIVLEEDIFDVLSGDLG